MVRYLARWVGPLVLVANLWAADDSAVHREASEIIIKWRELPRSLDAADLFSFGATGVRSVRWALPPDQRAPELNKIAVVEPRSSDDVGAVLAGLQRDPRIEWAEFRPIRHTDDRPIGGGRGAGNLDVVPNDPYYNTLWGLQAIETEAAWMETIGSPEVVIAVVDVGVYFDHPDLRGVGWENEVELGGVAGVDDDQNGYVDDFYGYDFMGQDGDPTPEPLEADQSHGTHVSGTIAALRNNGIGITGIAPGCRIMSVRSGEGSRIPYGYEGILYACRAGARVINCSWGGSSDSAFELEVIRHVLDQGCVVVASAGNDNVIDPHYPSGIEGVIGVAATQMGDFAASFTHYGPWVSVSAPGVSIVSTRLLDGGVPAYSAWQGTSMAAPHVAGICGLVASKYPMMGGREIASRVISSSESIDFINPDRAGYLGLGRVNAWRAVADELQGLRIADVSFIETVGEPDGRLLPGESAAITISVYNDLDPVDGVSATISTTADTLIISVPISVYGSIETGGPFASATPFELSLPALSSRGRTFPVSVDWTRADGQLLGRSMLTLELDTTYAVLDNGRMRLGFAENGCLGYRDYRNNVTLGPGLRVADDPVHALFHGSFLLAADGHVADNAYGNAEWSRYDWVPPTGVYAQAIESERADAEVTAEFRDRGSDAQDMLFAYVQAAALGWTADSLDRFLILEYTVTNESVNPWTDTYVGFFMDWDLGGSSGNRGGFDEEGDLAYVERTLSGYPLVGLASITDALGTVQTLDNQEELDPIQDWDDARKWELLSLGMGEDILEERDISQLIAAGPMTIGAHESQTLAFAVVTGDSRADLRDAAGAARSTYLPPASRKRPSPAPPKLKAAIVPNPIGVGEMKLLLPERAPARVRFYNVLGRQVGEVREVIGGPTGVTIDRAALGGASGLLFYRIETDGKQTLGKLVVLR